MKFVYLKDLAFEGSRLCAVGKVPIPATMQTPEMFAVSIWLKDVAQPLIITYATEEERDAEYDEILNTIEAL